MKRFISLVCYSLIAAFPIFAQYKIESNPNTQYTEISFDNLERMHLKFNYLRDRCIEFADLDLYSGSQPLSANNICDKIAFANILRSVRTMPETEPSWTAEEVLLEQQEMGDVNKCIIASALFQYLYIKEDALEKGLIRYENGNVYDNYIDGVWQDPYETDYIFAFAPQDTIFDSSVTFSFPENLWKTNYGGKFEFDAGDGQGYRTVSKGSTFSTRYNDGRHELKFRQYNAGKSLEAHSYITTKSVEASQSRGDDVFEPLSAYYNGKLYKGRLYREESRPGQSPFIYVEGLDVGSNNNKTEFDKNTGFGELTHQTIRNTLIDKDITRNYEFYYVDFEDGMACIEGNAAVLKEAIRYINSTKGYSQKRDNIVFGASMGGLTARYALRDMELNQEKHQTNVLICQDTPHLGANVPLGALYAVQDLLRMYNRHLKWCISLNDELGLIQRIMNSDAARQMLYNYVDYNGNINNTMHNAFMSKINDMGYPVGDDGQLRCLAISNGNDLLAEANKPLLGINGNVSTSELGDCLVWILSSLTGGTLASLGFKSDIETVLMSFLPGRNKIRVHAQINPTGSTNPICHIKLSYVKKFLWIGPNISHTFHNYSVNSPSGIHYDLARASYYDISEYDPETGTESGSFADLVKYKFNINLQHYIPFIPTASALHIGEGKTSLTMNDYTRIFKTGEMRPSYPTHTPFHSYYITTTSEPHIAFSQQTNQWLLSQLDMKVDGEPIASTGSKYILANNPNHYSVSWSVSDESIASIDKNGVLTVKKHGYVTVLATLSNGQVYPKQVMTGLPKFEMTSTFFTSYYDVQIKMIGDKPSDFGKFEPYIAYEIADKQGTNPLEWKDFTASPYRLHVSPKGNKHTVYIRPYYIYNNKKIYGEILFLAINTASPYIIEPNYFRVKDNSVVNTVTIKRNPNYTENLPNELKIRFIETHGQPISLQHTVTEITLNHNQVFNASLINLILNNYNQQSISENITIRNDKGLIIQSFNVSMARVLY